MTHKDFLALCAGGKQPLVRFTEEPDIDCFATKGMIAKVIEFVPDKHYLIRAKMDFSVMREHNLALQSHDWIKPHANLQTGTMLEAGAIKDDLIDSQLYDLDVKLPFELADIDDYHPMSRYLRIKDAHEDGGLGYVEWLESQFQSLTHPHFHPTSEEANRMTTEEVEALILQRMYNACIISERFEPKFRGNGHHFAQEWSRKVADAFLSRWRDS